jgi:hypothetical protein
MAWLGPFWRDLRHWVGDPRIGGPPSAPARPLLGGVVIAAAVGIGVLGSALALRRTEAVSDRVLRAGFTLVFTIAAFGYPGMLAVVLGRLTAPALWLAMALMAGGLGALWWRGRRPSIDVPAVPKEALGNRAIRFSFLGLCVFVVGMVAVHALMSSVLEWDAIVYHAESARQWFMARPAPPLVFGPSVGIEISANFPPLFPATGAAIYTLLGRFDDLYLRLVSPTALAALLLLVYGWARHRFDAATARLAVVLTLGAPLTVMYGAWTTSYMLLAALFLGTLILADLAAETESRWTWVAAGIVAGLAVLTSFYGVLAVPAGLAVVIVRRQRPRNLVLFVVVAGVVASPWLLRNLVLLHDPFFPLGSPPFPGRGLIAPIWQASKDEIRQNALGYWNGVPGLWLRLRELSTVFLDRHLPPMGAWVGLLLGLTMWRRRPRMAYLSLVVAIFGVAVWVPGWFWIRALLTTVPVAALLGAWALTSAFRADANNEMGHAPSRLRRLSRAAMALAIVATTIASCVVALAIAVAGPNHRTLITGLQASDNLMRGVEDWGDPRMQRWAVFGGDALLWKWIDGHVPAGERVATLEVRTYYMDHPFDLFYLDGIDAAPLLDLHGALAAEVFLEEHGVRYVMLPSWAMYGPTRHPVVDEMPLFRYLGTRQFPAVAAYPTGSSEVPSMVYAVGSPSVGMTVGVFPGISQPEPVTGGVVTIPTGNSDPRIAVPLGEGRWAIEFSYDRLGAGQFELNVFDPAVGRWSSLVAIQRNGSQGWTTTKVPLPPDRGYVMLGVHVEGAPLSIRDVRVVPLEGTPNP